MSALRPNVAKCVAYLRSIGVDIPDALAEQWDAQQTAHRQQQRAHRRELKRSCGHFRRFETKVIHDGGTTYVTNCDDCGQPLSYRGASL